MSSVFGERERVKGAANGVGGRKKKGEKSDPNGLLCQSS